MNTMTTTEPESTHSPPGPVALADVPITSASALSEFLRLRDALRLAVQIALIAISMNSDYPKICGELRRQIANIVNTEALDYDASRESENA